MTDNFFKGSNSNQNNNVNRQPGNNGSVFERNNTPNQQQNNQRLNSQNQQPTFPNGQQGGFQNTQSQNFTQNRQPQQQTNSFNRLQNTNQQKPTNSGFGSRNSNKRKQSGGLNTVMRFIRGIYRWARKRSPFTLGLIITAIAVMIFVAAETFSNPYHALNSSDKSVKVFTISSGETIDDVAKQLKSDNLITTAKAFSDYATSQNSSATLQIGSFGISASQDIPSIFKTLTSAPDPSVAQQAFIDSIAPAAQTMHQKYGVLASIDIAQAILESQWGQSELSQKYFNYYGMKAQGSQKSVTLSTQEYIDGQMQTVDGKFAVFDNLEQGVEAHAKFLKDGTDLKPNVFKDVIAATNYKDAAKALVTDGYATDPDYESKIINVIETYKLDQYDK